MQIRNSNDFSSISSFVDFFFPQNHFSFQLNFVMKSVKVHSPCSPRTNERHNGSRMLCRRILDTTHSCHRILEWQRRKFLFRNVSKKILFAQKNANHKSHRKFSLFKNIFVSILLTFIHSLLHISPFSSFTFFCFGDRVGLASSARPFLSQQLWAVLHHLNQSPFSFALSIATHKTQQNKNKTKKKSKVKQQKKNFHRKISFHSRYEKKKKSKRNQKKVMKRKKREKSMNFVFISNFFLFLCIQGARA
jgi:hypothetical protein